MEIKDETEIGLFTAGADHLAGNRETDSEDEHMGRSYSAARRSSRPRLGGLGPGGHITVNQMYVRYMVPQAGDGNVPVVMVHGATLTGKSWETTPDGRMGWDEYFVRKGHPVCVPDQVGRGRSGFNQAVLNDARAGSKPPTDLPVWLRFSDESVWPNFRFGATAGQPFSDSQFPVAAVDELSKQGVPDMFRGRRPHLRSRRSRTSARGAERRSDHAASRKCARWRDADMIRFMTMLTMLFWSLRRRRRPR
jgi:hypothetical protein